MAQWRIFASAFMLGVGTCALLVIVPMFAFLSDENLAAIRSRLWSQEAAGWVQAVGTLVAVAVAIWVPARLHEKQERSRARDRDVEAMGIAVLITGDLIDIQRALAGTHEHLQIRAQLGPPMSPADCQLCKVNIPDNLLAARPRAHVLPVLNAVGFLQFMSSLDFLNRTAEHAANVVGERGMGSTRATAAISELARVVGGAHYQLDLVMKRLGTFHNEAILRNAELAPEQLKQFQA